MDVKELRARYEEVAGAWQRQQLEDLERAGVDLRLGVASFLSQHEVKVVPPEGGYPDILSADAVIVATGSVPFLPPGLQPDGERVFSPHMVWRLPSLPRSMVVIGAGGPATEYVDAFSRLGVGITWITGPVAALSNFPPEAGRFITGVFERRGVQIVAGMMARDITQADGQVKVLTNDGSVYAAEMAFVAIGLRPDLERLNLAAAGLKVGSSGGMATDPFGLTSVGHIYLVGDAASPLSANISIAQGRVAGWHAAGLSVNPVRGDLAVSAIYTDPQVALIGRMSDRSIPLQKVRLLFKSCLRAHLLPRRITPDPAVASEDGFIEIAYQANGQITGALAVCPEAAEILTPLAVAIRAGMTIAEFASVNPAHPTFSELAILAARSVK